MNFSSAVATFAKSNLDARLAEMASNKSAGINAFANRRADLLSMFLKAQTERPDFMTDQRVLTMAVSMSFAGSETTGISLAAVFYYLLKNPRCHHTLMQELDEAIKSGKIQDRTSRLVSWSESQTLPYLDACIKESFRMHPAAGLPLERVTPPQGAEICGRRVAGGTIVGCSAWVIHRRPEIYGDDVDYYRPERWLEACGGKLKEMNASMFHFGAGSRTCIGKNISLLEIYKLVPSFLRRFEVRLLKALVRSNCCIVLTCLKITLARPNEEWHLHNAWFVKQLDFDTHFKTKPTLEAARQSTNSAL
jgi:cytochrome P450